MKDILSNILGDSWKKYTVYLVAISVLLYRDSIGLVQGRSQEEDLTSLAVFGLLSAAYLLGQGMADVGKSRWILQCRHERELHELTSTDAETDETKPPK